MAKRRSYETRSRSNTQAARILAKAFCQEVEFVMLPSGDVVRKWTAEEGRTHKDEDIARAIRRKRALEYHELLQDIPPPAVKYALSKGWLMERGGLYFVTEKAAEVLDLPRKTNDGLAIKFAKAA